MFRSEQVIRKFYYAVTGTTLQIFLNKTLHSITIQHSFSLTKTSLIKKKRALKKYHKIFFKVL